MKNIKFVVKLNRGAHAPQYVLRVDRLPILTTTNRKLALVMGRFTAEDAVKSMQNSHCIPELVSVRVSAKPEFSVAGFEKQPHRKIATIPEVNGVGEGRRGYMDNYAKAGMFEMRCRVGSGGAGQPIAEPTPHG